MSSRTQADAVEVPAWRQYPWLRHGFSTRHGGRSCVYGPNELNLGVTREDDPAVVLGNRRLFAGTVSGQGADLTTGLPVVAVRQVHGVTLKMVADGELEQLVAPDGRGRVEADGLATDVEDLLLAIQVADCVPVLIADVRQRVVAGFHAGWRGTAAAIVERGIAELQERFGSRPQDLIGAVGPAIGVCCYKVGDEVRDTFERNFRYASELFLSKEEDSFVDLAEANRRQMVDAGLNPESITLLRECTGCTRLSDGRRKYFSHRAENGVTGRAMAMIGIAAERRSAARG